MKIGIIGAGNIGGNCARQFTRVGHEVVLSFSRERSRLDQFAEELGEKASAGSVSDAAAADVVVLSVPWDTIDDIVTHVGDFHGGIVIDTTNQFSRKAGGLVDFGRLTAARVNADRLVGARYTKCFNTLTSGFQAAAASRSEGDRVVQWIAGDDDRAIETVVGLVDEIGYVPVVLAGIDHCAVMEAPRRPGAIYGEEYRRHDADAVIDAVRAGRPIPPTPSY